MRPQGPKNEIEVPEWGGVLGRGQRAIPPTIWSLGERCNLQAPSACRVRGESPAANAFGA